jgi:hypothetical protein
LTPLVNKHDPNGDGLDMQEFINMAKSAAELENSDEL